MLIGFIVQHHRDAEFRATHPASGSFVTVDGHRIHFRQSGEGDFTFVLEPGLGDYSDSWGTLESSLGKIGRVFVYDRAGLGWSEKSSHPRTAPQIVTELHDLLSAVHLHQPVILVGHSLGGITQVLYAMDYPEEVSGLLLIDPAHKDQFRKLPAPPATLSILFPLIARAAPFGLHQLLFHSSDPIQNQTSHVQTSGEELRAILRIADIWGNRPISLGDTPLYILTAGDDNAMPGKSEAEKRAAWEIWKALHAELLASSTSDIRKQVVVDGASHSIYRSHPEEVVSAAKEMVSRIKARTR
jgi:pimeloyl-ACP methyl ester carboxylesterase